MDRKAHWEAVHAERAPEEVSWFQEEPALSLELIRAAAPGTEARVLDVGGGASRLVDRLLDLGYGNVSVLDLSAAALERAKARLGVRAARVTWLVQDAASYDGPPVAVWHDRAAFHFCTDAAERAAYARAAAGAVEKGGTLILAGFAPDGPQRCSGLPVRRLTPADVEKDFDETFGLVDARRETHRTPWSSEQRFNYFVLRRR